MVRSPAQAISRPHSGLLTRRIRANIEMTAPTAALPTPNVRANTGSTGTKTPNPTATQKAMTPRTITSRGRVVRERSQRRAALDLPTGQCPAVCLRREGGGTTRYRGTSLGRWKEGRMALGRRSKARPEGRRASGQTSAHSTDVSTAAPDHASDAESPVDVTLRHPNGDGSDRDRHPDQLRHLRPQRAAGTADSGQLGVAGAARGGAGVGPGLAAAIPLRGRSSRSRSPACWPRCCSRWRSDSPRGDCPGSGGRHLGARRPHPDLRCADADRHPDRLAGAGAGVQRGDGLLRVPGLAPGRSATDRRQLAPPGRVDHPPPGVSVQQPGHHRRVGRGDRHPGGSLPGRLRDRAVRALLLPVRRPRDLAFPAAVLPGPRPRPGRRGGARRVAFAGRLRAGDDPGGPGGRGRRLDRGPDPGRAAGAGARRPGLHRRLHPAGRRLRLRLRRRVGGVGRAGVGSGLDHAGRASSP